MIEVPPSHYDRSRDSRGICNKVEIAKLDRSFISTTFTLVLSTNLLLVEVVKMVEIFSYNFYDYIAVHILSILFHIYYINYMQDHML
jgi:hypothetical protein